MNLQASLYDHARDYDDWGAFVDQAHAGTFLHKRRFLEYHGDRFKDRSMVFRDETGAIKAVLAAAIELSDCSIVSSHPGATFGGLLVRDRDPTEITAEALKQACAFYKEEGFSALIYKTVPTHFHKRLAEVDAHWLWLNGAEVVKRDLWNVISLNGQHSPSKGRKWGINKGKKAGLTISCGGEENDIADFHGILTHSLMENHKTSPVHSPGELKLLIERFPDEIKLWLARNEKGTAVSGTLVFNAATDSPHTQYIATTDEGRDLFAGDYLVSHVMDTAKADGATHFSFGASSEDGGRVLNSGLFNYKSGFGIGAVVHDTYRLIL